MPHLASPPGICLPLALNWPYPLITGTTWNGKLWILLQRPQPVGGGLSVTLGAPGHLSIAESVSCHLYNPLKALLPHQPEGLEGCREVPQWCCLPSGFNQGGGRGGRVYGLSKIWVNPYQARVSSVEEVVKQLTVLVSTGPVGLMPWCSLTGTPATHHSLERGTWASCQKEALTVTPAEGSAN